jgi:hypothetical protein
MPDRIRDSLIFSFPSAPDASFLHSPDLYIIKLITHLTARKMIDGTKEVGQEISMANSAIEKFIKDYALRMEYPVNFLMTMTARLENSSREVMIVNANINTVDRTLKQIDSILRELMSELEEAVTNSTAF